MSLMANTKQEKIINYGSIERSLIADQTSQRRTMKWLVVLQICTTFVTIIALSTFFMHGRYYDKKEHHYEPISTMNPSTAVVKEGLATLFALDPIDHTFCFKDGQAGMSISDWTVFNRCSDMDFNGYYKGNLTVGVEGGRVGKIIDLGNADELQRKYKYSETVSNGQGYASIHRTNQTLLILKETRPERTYQAMDESAALFGTGKSVDSVPAKLGHIYAIRITDRYESTFERLVKMIVVAYEPNNSISFRYEVLP